ncbi:MAG TPA: DUF2723 domain-containing protein, partial [Candidatus Cloacimonetes bacterium]|nr:DUF2723 domain-containing protein [Candidatus Cloacimonadota bacterium]
HFKSKFYLMEQRMNLKPQPVNKRNNTIIAWFVFFSALIIYALTQARSLSFWDAGEYITCSSILGVPHPPGNPFYIILGRFFTIIGLGLPHPIIVNFLSGLLSAFAVMFTYLFTVKFVSMWLKSEEESYLAYIAGFIAAIYTAFSFTFWNNAIEAEVYAGLAFVINLIVWLTMIWVEKSDNLSHQNYLILIIYIFFLGFGIHQTSLQIAPAILFIAVYPMLKDNIKKSGFWTRFGVYIVGLIIIYAIFNQIGKSVQLPALAKYMFALSFAGILYFHLRKQVNKKAWLIALLMIVIGISTHLFIYIRSEFRPFINEGHPHNLKLFMDYVLRRQYGVTSMFVRRASFLYQLKEQFLTYFSWQFFNAETLSNVFKAPQQFFQMISNLLVTLLGVGGAYYHFKKNKHSFAYFFSFFFMSSLAMIFVMNLSDAEVRDRDYFYVTAYNFWTVWMAIGSIGLIAFFKDKSKPLAYLVGAIVIALPLFNLATQYFIHDRHKEYIALDYGLNILNSVEENAIIFTNGDNDTFPVWYAQAVYDPKSIEFIHPSENDTIKDDLGKFQKKNIVQPTETTKEIISKAMDFKNEQCSGIRKDITIANLSLLNTPWYIKQLRDHEGVEFNVPDSHIEQCQDNPQSILYPKQLPEDMVVKIKGTDPEDSFTVTYKKGTIMYVKDLAALRIIYDNYGKRPIYFAVTVSETIGFENHLRNEGMVDRVVPTKGRDQYNIKRLTTNIDSVYSYRAIFDNTVYKDKNMTRLLNNYGAAFLRASQYFHRDQDYENAIKYMEKGLRFVQDKQRFYSGLSQLYLETGFHYLEKEENEKAFEFLDNAISYNPVDKSIALSIYQAAVYSEENDKGIALLEKIRPYQDSTVINQYIRKLEIEE